MKKVYKCIYTSGGGVDYGDGIWERKDVPKTISLTKLEESGVYDMHEVGEKIKVGKGTGNPLQENDDGTFVVYFKQAGTPYYFELQETISKIKQ